MSRRKKKVFFVSLHKSGKETEDILPDPSLRQSPRYLTIGDRHDCDIVVLIPGIPPRHRLLERRWSGYVIRIPSNMEGTLTIESQTLSIKGMIEFGLLEKKGEDCYLFTLPRRKICILKVEEITLTFGYKDILLPKKKTVKLERSLRRPWIPREDYTFLVILIMSATIHFSTVSYLNSIEIKEKASLEAIENIPHRFARLILQPPKKKVQKKILLKPAPDEKEEIKEGDRKETKREEEPQKEVKEEETLPPPAEEPPPPVKEEEIIPPQPEEPPPVTEEVAIAPEPDEPLPTITEEASAPTVPEEPTHPVTEEVAMVTESVLPPPIIKKEVVRKEKVRSSGLLGIIMAKKGPGKVKRRKIFRELTVDDPVDIKKSVPEKGIGNVLSDLNVKGIKRVEEVSRKIAVKPPPIETRPRATSEILIEKQEVLLEEIEEIDKDGDEIDSHTKVNRSETEIYKTIVSYVGGLKYLYNNALRKDPSLKGKITVKLLISPDGKVRKAEIISSTLHDLLLEEAIINRIYRWRFPKLKDGEDDFKISYTFDFAPGG